MTEGSAPAGWYPDGQGRHRWWDGTQWTDEIQQEASGASEPTGDPLNVKGAEGVAELDGQTLTFTFGRLASRAKKAASPVRIDLATAHEIQVIEPTVFKPGLIRVVQHPDQEVDAYSTDPLFLRFPVRPQVESRERVLDCRREGESFGCLRCADVSERLAG